MAEASNSDENLTVDRKLSEIFEEAYHLYNDFENNQEPTNSTEYQVCG